MRLSDAAHRLTRLEIDRDHRRMGWLGLALAAAGILSLTIAALFFDL